MKQCRLDELKFARVMPLIVHFSSAATIFAPELADARMVLSQTCMLITVYDDFFDCPEISREEKENYIALIEKYAQQSNIRPHIYPLWFY